MMRAVSSDESLEKLEQETAELGIVGRRFGLEAFAEAAARHELALEVRKRAGCGRQLPSALNTHHPRRVEPCKRLDLAIEPARLVLVHDHLDHAAVRTVPCEPALAAATPVADRDELIEGAEFCLDLGGGDLSGVRARDPRHRGADRSCRNGGSRGPQRRSNAANRPSRYAQRRGPFTVIPHGNRRYWSGTPAGPRGHLGPPGHAVSSPKSLCLSGLESPYGGLNAPANQAGYAPGSAPSDHQRHSWGHARV